MIPFVLGITSCLSDLEEPLKKFENVKGAEWNPSVAAPIVSSRLTLADILDQTSNSYILVDDDDLLHLIYNGDLLSLEANQVISIPDQKFDGSIKLFPFQILDLQNNGTTSLNFSTVFDFGPKDMELDSIIMNACGFVSTLTSSIQHDVTVTFSLPGITDKEGKKFSVKYDMPYKAGGSTSKRNIDLSNSDFNLSQSGDKEFSQLKAEFNITVNKVDDNPVDPDDEVHFNTDFLYNEYEVLYGFVGNIDISPAEADSINLNIFNNTNKGGTTGTFSLNDPKVKIRISNSYGLPIESKIIELTTISPKYGNNTLTGYPDPLNIPVPTYAQVGKTLTDSFSLDKNNSNIRSLLSNVPDKVVYNVAMQVNPPGSKQRNFILYHSKVNVGLSVDIPFYASADGFVIEDEQPLTLDADLSNIDSIESATIRLYIENDFPIDVGLQVYFADEQGNIVDSLVKPYQLLLASPPVDSKGESMGHTSKTIDFVVDHQGVQNILKAKKAIIRGTLNTYKPSGGGAQPEVKFLSKYGIYVKVGVQSTVKGEVLKMIQGGQ